MLLYTRNTHFLRVRQISVTHPVFTEIAKLATHLPKVLADAESVLASLGRQAAQGVDLSPASLEELARARRSSDRSLLLGIAAILAAAIWLFRR